MSAEDYFPASAALSMRVGLPI